MGIESSFEINSNEQMETSGFASLSEVDKKPTVATLAKSRLVSILDRMYVEGKKVKVTKTGNWDLNDRIYRGGVWPTKRPKHKISAVLNLVQPYIERKAALLTDTKPTIRIQHTYTGASGDIRQAMEDVCKVLELVATGLWQELSVSSRLSDAVHLAEIYGIVGFNTIYNDELGTRGMPDLLAVDPRKIIIDPLVTRTYDVDKAEYLILEEVWALSKIKDVFGSDGDKVVADFNASNTHGDSGQESGGLFKSLIDKVMSFNKETITPAIDRVFVREYWIKDRTRDSEGKKVFPGGRHIIKAGNVILLDEPNPYYDNRIPVDLLNWHFDPNGVWSFGDLELYTSPQTLINKILATIVENSILANNQIWIGDYDALDPEEWNKLSDAPGLKVKKKPGRELRREAPPDLPSALFNTLQALMGGMDKVSGITSALEGNAPGSIQSGVAVESLQSAAQTTIRLKARCLEDVMQKFGQKLISRIFQFMTEDRIFHIVGDGGLMKAYHFERRRLQTNPKTAFADYKFIVVPGSSLSIAKYQKGQQALQLFTLGINDDVDVLDKMEYPDRDKVLERKQKKEQEMMQQQLLMAQLTGGQTQPPQGKGGKPGGRVPGQLPASTKNSPDRALQQKPVSGAPDVKG